ncbi:MAG: hypothetical protein IPK04_18480 [Bdellovibrionales bacterium]|nr:hypothetical protein [Bdellovibrionales bacterium]
MGEVLAVALDEVHLKRLQSCADSIQISKLEYSSVDDVIVVEPAPTPRVILISCISVSTKEEVAGQVQTLKQFFPDSFIIVLLEKKNINRRFGFCKEVGWEFRYFEF